MTQYNPKSLNAEEFINDAEILDTSVTPTKTRTIWS